MIDQDYIILLKDEIIAKQSIWGDASEWTDYQFNILSLEIEKETKVCISPTTLKRIFGKRKHSDHYNPQIETKNSICKYLGYSDWFAFKSSKINDTGKEYSPKDKKISSEGIIFTITDTVGPPPLCPKISYKINSESQKYSVILREGLCRDLNPKYNYLSHPYEVPGYFDLLIFENENLIESTGVHAITKGWEAGICYKKWNFTRIIDNSSLDDGTLPFILLSDVEPADSVDKWYWIQYRNFFLTEADGDNFSIKTRVKNNYNDGGIPYYDIILTVIGENGKIEVFFIDRNQHYWIESSFSEIELNGEFYDLSSFVRNLSAWSDIEVKNSDKDVRIFFNQKEFFSLKYEKPLGNIKGCMLTFRGFGSCQYFHLFDNSGNQIIKDNIKILSK